MLLHRSMRTGSSIFANYRATGRSLASRALAPGAFSRVHCARQAVVAFEADLIADHVIINRLGGEPVRAAADDHLQPEILDGVARAIVVYARQYKTKEEAAFEIGSARFGSSAFQKPSAPSATASSGPIVSPRRLRRGASPSRIVCSRGRPGLDRRTPLSST